MQEKLKITDAITAINKCAEMSIFHLVIVPTACFMALLNTHCQKESFMYELVNSTYS